MSKPYAGDERVVDGVREHWNCYDWVAGPYAGSRRYLLDHIRDRDWQREDFDSNALFDAFLELVPKSAWTNPHTTEDRLAEVEAKLDKILTLLRGGIG